MASSEGDFPENDCENFNENAIMSKYGRHKDETTGRWVWNNPVISINTQKFGDRGPYIVEAKENLNKNRRPEAGHYLNHLLNESFVMNGPGEGVEVVNWNLPSYNQRNRLLWFPLSNKKFSIFNGGDMCRAFDGFAGFDVIGHAITGGGKTAAFLIPVINYISIQKNRGSEGNTYPYCIVVSPTKELAEQLYEDTLVFSAGLNCTAVISFGEIPRQDNIAHIREGCDIFICTVGRLCDYLQNEILELRHLRFLVFDEADRLLQMEGFYHDLMENLLPKCRNIPNLRKMLFSATDYSDLAELKDEFLMPNATKVVVGALNSVNPFIEQQVLNVEVHERRKALLDLVQDMYLNIDKSPPPKTIIFVNTKRSATVIACYLSLKGYKAYPIHGNLTAKLRREAIEALQSGNCHIMVSTDVAARGLDIKGISHIINYEIPRCESFLSYVHRVGRTGRAGNVGRATTFFAPSVDHGMTLTLYRWLEMNKQEIPAFLLEAKLQIDIEDLQRKKREEYEQAFNKSHIESSDGEMDR